MIPGTRVGRTYTETRSERCVPIGRSVSRSAHTDLRLRLADACLRFIVLFERARRHLRVFICFITVPKVQVSDDRRESFWGKLKKFHYFRIAVIYKLTVYYYNL